MSGPRTVSGEVRMTEPLPTPGGMLRVTVEDVSRADAPSVVVAETVIPVHGGLPAGGSVSFSVVVPNVDARAHYSVRAHLDTTGSGDVTSGDRLSMAAHPVLTGGHPDRVAVEARTVR